MFSWFKRSKRSAAKTPRRLPRRELAPVDDIIEQGLLVTDVAVRMTVKNDIIMNALKRRMDYDEQQIANMVVHSIEQLADERERDARHIGRVRGEVKKFGSSAWTDAEYGNDDNRTLRHRQQVYEGVAAELRRRADDQEYVTRTAQRAREAAWEEIGASIAERATHPYYSGGASAEYQRARDKRIQLLIERDLTELVRMSADEPSAGTAGSASASGGAAGDTADGASRGKASV